MSVRIGFLATAVATALFSTIAFGQSEQTAGCCTFECTNGPPMVVEFSEPSPPVPEVGQIVSISCSASDQMAWGPSASCEGPCPPEPTPCLVCGQGTNCAGLPVPPCWFRSYKIDYPGGGSLTNDNPNQSGGFSFLATEPGDYTVSVLWCTFPVCGPDCPQEQRGKSKTVHVKGPELHPDGPTRPFPSGPIDGGDSDGPSGGSAGGDGSGGGGSTDGPPPDDDGGGGEGSSENSDGTSNDDTSDNPKSCKKGDADKSNKVEIGIANAPPQSPESATNFGYRTVDWSFVGDSHGASLYVPSASSLTAELTSGYESGIIKVRATINLYQGPTFNPPLGPHPSGTPPFPAIVVDKVFRIKEPRNGCSDGDCSAGQGFGALSESGIDFSWTLGKDRDGSGINDIQLFVNADTPDAAIVDPQALLLPGIGEQVSVHTDVTYTIIYAPETTAKISWNPSVADQYSIAFSTPVSYGQSPGVPHTTWEIKKLTAPSGSNYCLEITKKIGTDVKKVYEYLRLTSDAPYWKLTIRDATTNHRVEEAKWVDNVRTLTVKDGSANTYYRVDETFSGSKVTGRTVYTAPTGSTGMTTIRDYYSSGANTGLLKLIKRPNGSWTYYEYEEDGRRKLVAKPLKDEPPPTGEPIAANSIITKFNYEQIDTNDKIEGQRDMRPRRIIVETGGVETSRTYKHYARATPSSSLVVTTVRCGTPGIAYLPNDPTNLKSVTTYWPGNDDRVVSIQYPDGRVDSYDYQDNGTFTVNSSNRGASSQFTDNDSGTFLRTIVKHGYLSGNNVVYLTCKSTQDVTVTNQFGAVVFDETLVAMSAADTWQQIAWTAHDLDSQGRALETYRFDNTRVSRQWGCCAQTQVTDENGIVTVYDPPDALGRIESVTKKGSSGDPVPNDIVTSYAINAAKRLTGTTIEASGGPSLSTSRTYDFAGRVVSTTEAGLTTTYAYTSSSSGGRIVTVTYPADSGTSITRVTEYFRDGRVKSVTGSAVVPQFYEYEVHPSGQRGITSLIGASDSLRWTKTWYDMLGRVASTIRAGFVASGSIANVSTNYNYKDYTGQLAYTVKTELAGDTSSGGGGGGLGGCIECPGGGAGGAIEGTTVTGSAPMHYEYDEMGNVIRTWSDIDNSGSPDVNGPDRINDTEACYHNDGTNWWLRSETSQYLEQGSSAPTLAAVEERQITGLTGSTTSRTVSTNYQGMVPRVSTSTTTVDRGSKLVTDTTDLANSSINAETVTRNGLVQSSKTSTGLTYTYGYDGIGRRVTTTDPRIGVSTTHYDSDGRVDYVKNADNNQTTYTYDGSGRLKSAMVTEAGTNRYTRYDYNERGQVIHVWGETPQPVEIGYNTLGERTSLKTFRMEQSFTSASWPNPTGGDQTTWVFDPATGLLTSKTDARSFATSYSYSPGGALKVRTWARGPVGSNITTTYDYNELTGQLENVDYSDSTPDVAYTYDRIGRVETVTDGQGTRTFAYDFLLESESMTGLYDKVLTHSVSLPIDPPLPSWSEIRFLGVGSAADPWLDYQASYYFDGVGRLSRVSGTAMPNISANYTVVTDASSQPVSELISKLEYASSSSVLATTTRSYEDHRDLITGVDNKWGSMTVSNYGYGNDSLGRRTSVIRTGSAFGTSHLDLWAYNNRNELTGSTRYNETSLPPSGSPVTAGTYGYAYDPIGNRETSTAAGVGSIYSVAIAGQSYSLNQYTSITTGSTAENFSYDRDGNLWKDGTYEYLWDAENRLIEVKPKTSPTITSKKLVFAYDYLGRRVRKQVFTRTTGNTGWNETAWTDTRFVYDGWNLIMELEGTSNTVRRTYLWGLDLSGSLQGAGGIGGLLAMYDTDGTSSTSDDKNFVYFYDANGNVGQLMDLANGSVFRMYEYDPYGRVTNGGGPVPSAGDDVNSFRFSTKYCDDELADGATEDMYYYGYRYYSPRLGRWASRDPIGTQYSPQLYEFCVNNPFAWIDPEGLTPQASQPSTCQGQAYVPGNIDVQLGSSDRGPGSSSVLVRLTPKTKCQCDEIKFAQIAQTKQISRFAGIQSGDPWHIDAEPPSKPGSTYPFYPTRDTGGCKSKFRNGGLEMDDDPGNDSRLGPYFSFFALTQEFETCAICIIRNPNGTYKSCQNLGCATWGHSGRDGVITHRWGGGNGQQPQPPTSTFKNLTQGKFCGGLL